MPAHWEDENFMGVDWWVPRNGICSRKKMGGNFWSTLNLKVNIYCISKINENWSSGDLLEGTRLIKNSCMYFERLGFDQ